MTHRGILWMCLLVMLMGISAIILQAQSTGQVCVRAFEDRNGNGTHDANEPPIIQGVNAVLTDERGVIINTRMVEDSAEAASGLTCFQRLESGQYGIRVSSADYTATTPDQFVTQVDTSSVPTVFEFGGQRIIPELPQSDAPDFSLSPVEQRTLIQKLIVAGIGSVVVIGAMAFIGALIAFIFYRQPSPDTVYTGYTGRLSTQGIPPASLGNMQAVVKAERAEMDDTSDNTGTRPPDAAASMGAIKPITDSEKPKTQTGFREDFELTKPDNFLDAFLLPEDSRPVMTTSSEENAPHDDDLAESVIQPSDEQQNALDVQPIPLDDASQANDNTLFEAPVMPSQMSATDAVNEFQFTNDDDDDEFRFSDDSDEKESTSFTPDDNFEFANAPDGSFDTSQMTFIDDDDDDDDTDDPPSPLLPPDML